MSDIATLFARNPLELTKEDITAIVTEFRKSRHAFNAGNLSAGRTKPLTAKQQEIKSLSDKIDFTL